MIDWSKIFRSSTASDSPWRMATSVKKGGRRTALRDCQSRCFLEPLRLPAAARRRASLIGRRFFPLSGAKAISMLNEITEGEPRLPARAKD